ncbi:hypothetical protein AMS68_002643 [Peltaster fructicola]|uniref:non-specific serine/threonine protein kinase n=1 Tax=Peltaster fructicola TaxID=286661 RepID=A0A6H0XR14_9PEZI|nr:hypothetical protein AMS68_002643 [Peltaster fructicola]
MDECTQPVNTQDIYDPRRMGRNNSGLNVADISDVLCILHPATPAAFRIVAHTADRAPQYVLQNNSFSEYEEAGTQQNVEEAETFIIGSDKPHAMDLALRFSAKLLRPELGFVFGRNPLHCDVVLDGDTSKRISNLHFRIYINNQGVLMLEDASTNGTIVDEQVLNGKPEGKRTPGPPARMLQSGSIIQIVSPKPEEIIKFILRIPNREGHEAQFQQNFHLFMRRVTEAQVIADKRFQQGYPNSRLLFPPSKPSPSGSNIRAPVSSIHFGMHWSGGEKYSVVGNIGKGAFATVYQIATKTDGQLFAAKELDKRRCMKNGVLDRKVTNEMQIMQTVNHPNIVQYIEYRDVEHYLYIIMEFVPGGDLQQYLAQHGRLTEAVAKRMSSQVLEALDYLHINKITHRDIKPDNILLADTDPDNFTIKLSDFGLSKVVADDKETFLKTFCGTLLYCAPEVFPHYDQHVAGKGKKRTRRSAPSQPTRSYHSYSQSVDIWSFAAVLWYSLCMEPPFEGVADTTGKGMFDKIMMTPLDTTALIRAGVSNSAIELLIDMLNTDPSARPTPAMCLQHPWFGGKGIKATTTTAGLGAIAEEHENEAPDVGGLSLGEQPSQSSQLSINSADYNFFDPRQSKRFKSDVFDYREHGAPIDSSPEVVFDHIPIANQVTPGPEQVQKAAPKLFGEISQSGLVQLVSGTVKDKTQSFNSEEEALALQHSDPRVLSQRSKTSASPSLLGAESLVRELKMHSPQGSGGSPTAEVNDPATPEVSRTKASVHDSASEITPRPPQRFNRQISIPFPPSLYWDSADPSTHNNEYASKVSGHDFTRHPSIIFPINSRNSGSATDKDNEDESTDGEHLNGIAPNASQFAKPSPLVGKLISTADSFKAINLTLTRRREDWGRAPSNTQVYADGQDTRIPRRAIIIWFFASGIEKFAEDDDGWTELPDLQATIMTEKRGGVLVNGIHLPKNEPERHFFGRLYTGDEIEVFSKDGEVMKFICEFFQGIGRQSRPQNVPQFHVELAQDKTLSQTMSKAKEDSIAGAERP